MINLEELIGSEIKRLRILNNINKSEMCKKLNISEFKYNQIESGNSNISYDMVTKVCNIFNMKENDVLNIVNIKFCNKKSKDNDTKFTEIMDMIDFFYANKKIYNKVNSFLNKKRLFKSLFY